MRYEEKLITPEEAAQILSQCNTSNRKIAEYRIRAMADDMKAGRWRLNGDAIRFGISGRLLDGQHRLTACVRAEVPIEFLVIRDIEDSAFSTIDMNKTKSIADMLKCSGYRNCALMASIASLYISAKQFGFCAASTAFSNARAAPAATFEEAISNPSIIDAVNFVVSLDFIRSHGLSTIIGAMLLILRDGANVQTREQYREFCSLLESGIGLREMSPVLKLRNRMVENKGHRMKLDRYDKATFVVKAWNAFYDGSSLTTLRYSSTEAYPTISGISDGSPFNARRSA